MLLLLGRAHRDPIKALEDIMQIFRRSTNLEDAMVKRIMVLGKIDSPLALGSRYGLRE
jgi:hypothetical protein